VHGEWSEHAPAEAAFGFTGIIKSNLQMGKSLRNARVTLVQLIREGKRLCATVLGMEQNAFTGLHQNMTKTMYC